MVVRNSWVTQCSKEAAGFVDKAVFEEIKRKGNDAVHKRIDSIIHDSHILSELSRIPHDIAIKNFREKDELNFEINKAKIRAILSAQQKARLLKGITTFQEP